MLFILRLTELFFYAMLPTHCSIQFLLDPLAEDPGWLGWQAIQGDRARLGNMIMI
jgi:hypothetical protein